MLKAATVVILIVALAFGAYASRDAAARNRATLALISDADSAPLTAAMQPLQIALANESDCSTQINNVTTFAQNVSAADPQSDTIKQLFSEIAAANGDCEQLLENLKRLPASDQLFQTWGKAFLDDGDVLNAIRAYEVTLSVAPQNAVALTDLLYIYEQARDDKNKLRILQKIQSAATTQDATFFMREAELAELSGSWDEAAAAYGRACELEPAGQCYLQAARVYHRQLQDEMAATTFYRKAIEHDAQTVEAWQGLSFLLTEQGQITQSNQLLDEMAQALPTSDLPTLYRGWNAYLRNDFAEAQQYFQEAVALNDQNPLTLNMLGHTHRQLNDLESALAAFTKNAALNPFDSSVFAEMAEISAELNQPTACQYATQALALSAENAKANTVAQSTLCQSN